jgi:hypothetical protein
LTKFCPIFIGAMEFQEKMLLRFTDLYAASNYIPKRLRICINYEMRSERGISIDANFGPPRYVL